MKLINAIDERIGNLDLFYGRKRELEYLMTWVDDVPKKINKSLAILSRSKKGKTALVERLYNIVYSQKRNIIPFYYEIREYPYYVIDFAEEFYLSFIQQYIAFKIRKPEIANSKFDLHILRGLASDYELEHIVADIYQMIEMFKEEENEAEIVYYSLSAPDRIAKLSDEFVIQIIDEFQLLTTQIYLDKDREHLFEDIIGNYNSLAKSKNAPIIATGSKLGWLKELIHDKLPSRFKEMIITDFDKKEAIGATLNYADFLNIKISKKMAYVVAYVAEFEPYYIKTIMMSDCPKKKFDTIDDILDILMYEITKGDIYLTWKDYFEKALDVSENNIIKDIVLELSENSKKEYKIKEIIETCNINHTEEECEKLIRHIIKADLIQHGNNKYLYKGIEDDILGEVLEYEYHFDGNFEKFKDEINEFKNKLRENLKNIDLEEKIINFEKEEDEIQYKPRSNFEKSVDKIFQAIKKTFTGKGE